MSSFSDITKISTSFIKSNRGSTSYTDISHNDKTFSLIDNQTIQERNSYDSNVNTMCIGELILNDVLLTPLLKVEDILSSTKSFVDYSY
jgi:hypothetical protein